MASLEPWSRLPGVGPLNGTPPPEPDPGPPPPAPLAVGDVVRLKHGGPRMTVVALDEAGAACVWFVRRRDRAAKFLAAALERVPRPWWRLW